MHLRPRLCRIDSAAVASSSVKFHVSSRWRVSPVSHHVFSLRARETEHRLTKRHVRSRCAIERCTHLELVVPFAFRLPRSRVLRETTVGAENGMSQQSGIKLRGLEPETGSSNNQRALAPLPQNRQTPRCVQSRHDDFYCCKRCELRGWIEHPTFSLQVKCTTTVLSQPGLVGFSCSSVNIYCTNKRSNNILRSCR